MQFLLKDVCQVDHLHIHFKTGTTDELKIWWDRWGKDKVIEGNLQGFFDQKVFVSNSAKIWEAKYVPLYPLAPPGSSGSAERK